MTSPRSRRSFLKTGAVGAATGATLAGGLVGLAHAVERTPRSSSPSDLKITGVRGGLIRGEHSLFVKIETNQGITGHGQAVDGVYGTYYVMKHLARNHLIGRNPLDVHRLQEEMRRGGIFKGAQAGMYVCVMSALEIASPSSSSKFSPCASVTRKSASLGAKRSLTTARAAASSILANSAAASRSGSVTAPPSDPSTSRVSCRWTRKVSITRA